MGCKLTELELCETGDISDLKRGGKAAEEKLDGTRGRMVKRGKIVLIMNRDGVAYQRRLPEAVHGGEEIPGDFEVDGEIVYINPATGKSEFTPCQRRCSTSDIGKVLYLQTKYPIQFHSFDLLELNGQDTKNLPYLERKQLLAKLIPETNPSVKYVPHRFDLEDFFKQTTEDDEEGLILKDVGSRYEPGRRSFHWLKVKNWRTQVCRVVGWTQGSNARSSFFGALVLTNDEDRFCGLVGGGFDESELRKIKGILQGSPKTLRPFEIDQPYTAVDVLLWVEVRFYKPSENGILRFPTFKGVA